MTYSGPGLLSLSRLLTKAMLFSAVALLALPTLAADSASTAVAAPTSIPVNSANPAHLIAAKPSTTTVPTSSSAGSSSRTMLFGLLLVLGLIVCIAWLLKRSGLTPAMQASATAKTVGGVNVGNRERVVVVEIADQWIVVGVAPGRVNALATMPKQESPATLTPSASPAKNFSSWMKQTIEKRNASR